MILARDQRKVWIPQVFLLRSSHIEPRDQNQCGRGDQPGYGVKWLCDGLPLKFNLYSKFLLTKIGQ